MKRRQYAIIFEENCLQKVWEFSNISEAIDIVSSYTFGYFWHEDDCLPVECIDTRNFIGLRQYLLFLNKEEYHDNVNLYCDVIERLYRVKHTNQLKKALNSLNDFLIQVGSDTRL